MPVVASGQITLVDLSDAKGMQVFISANKPFVQINNRKLNSYTPDWEVDNLILTPSAYVTGINRDVIGEVDFIKWYKDGVLINENTPGHQIMPDGRLIVLKNILATQDFVNYNLDVEYTDPLNGTLIDDNDSVEFAKLFSGADGESAMYAFFNYPDGTVFKNADGSEVKRIEAIVMNGSSVINTNLSYKWYFADPNVIEGHPDYDQEGGEGWSLISDSNNDGGSYLGYSSRMLSVKADGVDSSESFKVSIQYSNREPMVVIGTLIDVADPYQIIIEGDNIFKNAIGNLNLKARVLLNGDEVLDKNFKYEWHAFTEEGTLFSSWEAFTSAITVDAIEVPEKGYFTCDVYLP